MGVLRRVHWRWMRRMVRTTLGLVGLEVVLWVGLLDSMLARITLVGAARSTLSGPTPDTLMGFAGDDFDEFLDGDNVTQFWGCGRRYRHMCRLEKVPCGQQCTVLLAGRRRTRWSRVGPMCPVRWGCHIPLLASLWAPRLFSCSQTHPPGCCRQTWWGCDGTCIAC